MLAGTRYALRSAELRHGERTLSGGTLRLQRGECQYGQTHRAARLARDLIESWY